MEPIRRMAVRALSNRHEIQNKDSEATIYLYGDIGGYFGVDHKEWIQELNAIDSDTIHLRIDSDGGDVFAARAMKTAIMQHEAKVIAHIDGLAASAASFLAMGADEIEIVDGGFIMIHNAASFIDILGYFNADDLQELINDITKERNLHEKINEAIANDYAKGTGKSKDDVLALMAAETWFTAAEALDQKFVDRVYDGQLVEGAYDLSTFRNTPQAVTDRNTQFSKRALEKALRDVGLPQQQAKAILAGGFKDGQRDVVPPNDDTVVVDNADTRDVNPAGDDSPTDTEQRDAVVPDNPQDRTAELVERTRKLFTTIDRKGE